MLSPSPNFAVYREHEVRLSTPATAGVRCTSAARRTAAEAGAST